MSCPSALQEVNRPQVPLVQAAVVISQVITQEQFGLLYPEFVIWETGRH